MRILYSHRIQSRDGQSVHVEELVTAFLQEGHAVLVVGPGFYAQAGFGGESRLVAWVRGHLPGALGELAEIAYAAPAAWRLWRAARRFKPDLIYERYNLFHLAGMLVARATGTPFFLEVNSPLAQERAAFGGLALRPLAFALERRVWQRADRVLAVTAVLGRIIAQAGVDPARIEVVANGINPDHFLPPVSATDPTPSLAAEEPVTLGFVGFVRDWHGLDGVIAGLPALPSLCLDIVGDGPARPDLERQAQHLGVTARVRFSGLVDHALVPTLVAGFDIALQPKVVDYASPLKIFDYMAAGIAIVAPDQPNIREILQHEANALLFDPADPAAMWQAIRRLADDGALRRRLGAAARTTLLARNFTWRGNAARIAALVPGQDVVDQDAMRAVGQAVS